jgi:hypothetical protein
MNMHRAGMAITYRVALAMWLALLSGSGLASTASVPEHIRNEIPQAHLLGAGAYTWFGLKIYDARLWVGESGYQQGTKDNARFALDLQYARDLKGDRIADASLKEIKRLGIGTPRQHQAWLARMIDLFPDVQDGTHITGVYLPAQGARFYLNGVILGEVLDPDFAHAFFAIWLDPRTSDKALRNALLAGTSKQ